MKLREWINKHGTAAELKFIDCELPTNITTSCIKSNISTKLMLWPEQTKNYYEYFPLHMDYNNDTVAIYYININKKSRNYHKVSFLLITPSNNNHTLKLNNIKWNRFKTSFRVVYDKIIKKQKSMANSI